MKDLLRTADFDGDSLMRVLDASSEFKREPMSRHDLLQGETVVLYFNKPSTRTRVSFEAAIARLGGTPVSVGPNELQLDRGETIAVSYTHLRAHETRHDL